ncbi:MULTISPECIES: response regulator transcription factor [Burkholderia]|uniref:response regulator transcription factor n=1 Tax=Burkholderia TaxID=32008 RepID=UPI0009E8012C|nr:MULTISPECIES: response regulator transcription factor [Burkholderia]
MEKIKVGVADSQPVVLAGISSALSGINDIELIFGKDSVREMLEAIRNNRIDVLICDFEFEDDFRIDGARLLGIVKDISPGTRVLFFSASSTPEIVSRALKAGAAGFVSKLGADFSRLATGIRDAYLQKIYLAPSLAGTVIYSLINQRKGVNGVSSLSKCEAAVARLICDGLSIDQIAKRMSRSPKTISNQKNSAKRKLGARSDIELARIMNESK